MKLFEPIKIGNVELKNRVIMAPMENGMAEVGTGAVSSLSLKKEHNIILR